MPDRSKRPAVRLSDVAKRARCSAATVSRVLNTPEIVNREARLRVEAAVHDLGYTRNGAARALRSRRSQMVGIVLPTLKQPIYADVIDGVQTALAGQGYALVVTTSNGSVDQELLQARLLAERGVDGLVLIGHGRRPELHRFLKVQDLPYVVVGSVRPKARYPVVAFDGLAGMASVAEHLVGLGHRDIAMLAGRRGESDWVDQWVEGVAATFEALGVGLPPERIVEEASTIEGGRRGLRRLAAFESRPTALVCAGDHLAYGALIECRVQGIDVPADMSMTGSEDLPASAHLVPPLTTLAIPFDEMGRRAGESLLARFAGRPHAAAVLLETRLVVRRTTAPPRGRP